MGKPRPPDLEERYALQEASRLQPVALDGVWAGDSAVEVAFAMRTHSVCLLEFVPV
jgi:hypothetical protein